MILQAFCFPPRFFLNLCFLAFGRFRRFGGARFCSFWPRACLWEFWLGVKTLDFACVSPSAAFFLNLCFLAFGCFLRFGVLVFACFGCGPVSGNFAWDENPLILLAFCCRPRFLLNLCLLAFGRFRRFGGAWFGGAWAQREDVFASHGLSCRSGDSAAGSA